MPYQPWHDPTIKAAARELIAAVPEADRPLLKRWMDDPRDLTGDELLEMELRILPAIRARFLGTDQQVSYRWVDDATGEVDDW